MVLRCHCHAGGIKPAGEQLPGTNCPAMNQLPCADVQAGHGLVMKEEGF